MAHSPVHIGVKSLFLLAFLLPLRSTSALFAQAAPPVDSLEKVLTTAVGNHRASILYMLSWAYRFSDKDKAIQYGEEGLTLGRQLRDTAAIASSLNSLSETWLNFGDFDKAEKLTLEELPYAKALLPLSKNYLGALTRLGTIHYRRGKFDQALEYQLEVLREADKIKKPEIIGVAQLNAGLTYMDLKRNDEALQCFQTALSAFESIHYDAGVGACYVNLAEVYRNKRRYQDAIDAGLKGIAILEKSGNKVHLGYIYGSLGKTYGELADNDNSIVYHKKGLEIATGIHDDFMTALNKLGLGRAQTRKGQFALAKPNLDSALQTGLRIGEKAIVIESYAALRDWHLMQRDFLEAKQFDDLFNMGMDSVFNAKMAEKVADSQIKYETEKKEAEITRQKLTLLQQRTWLGGLGIVLIVLPIVGFLFYNRFRLRKKAELDAAVIREQTLGIKAVIEAQESERKRIARELHDGIAQELVALKLGFDALGRKVSNTAPEARTDFQELGEQLDASCTELRGIAHAMSPPGLAQNGLAGSLQQLLQHTLQSAGVAVQFEAKNLPDRLSEQKELGLYRIAQELLNNVVKHARATQVGLELYRSGDQICMQMTDNGIGYDFEAARSKGSMGLLNIISRASALGGVFSAEKNIPGGTVSRVSIPV